MDRKFIKQKIKFLSPTQDDIHDTWKELYRRFELKTGVAPEKTSKRSKLDWIFKNGYHLTLLKCLCDLYCDIDPIDENIILRDGVRYYKGIYPSVTSILRNVELRYNPMRGYNDTPYDDLSLAQKKRYNSLLLNLACVRGNYAHHLCEGYLKGFYTKSDLERTIANKLIYNLNRVQSSRHPILSEFTVYSRYGYAGTADLIGEVDGVLTIVDFKTSKKPLTESVLRTRGYLLQLAAYVKAYEEMTGKRIERGIIWNRFSVPLKTMPQVYLREFKLDRKVLDQQFDLFREILDQFYETYEMPF